MGRVWLAHNDVLDTNVAIKFLRSELTAPDASLRFAREARMTACVDHPAVVRVFDFGKAESGLPYIVMEHLEGQTFADLLDSSGTLSAIDAVRILLPIVDGLTTVHDLGIVHRDIKPENVFLAREAGRVQPKLLDFGIARLEAQEEASADSRLTHQGSVLGSPSYMSPEQARGQTDVDARADVWGVCILVYEAIAGTCPFKGDTCSSILRAIIEEPILPLSEGPESAGIWSILQHGLAKRREARISTMRELGRDLATWLLMRGVNTDIHGNGLRESWGITDGARRLAALRPADETLLSLEAPGPRDQPFAGPAVPVSLHPSPLAIVSRARTRAFWTPVGLASAAVTGTFLVAFAVHSSARAGGAQVQVANAAALSAPGSEEVTERLGGPPSAFTVATADVACAHGESGPDSARGQGPVDVRAVIDTPLASQGARTGSRRAPDISRDRIPRPEELGLKRAY